MPVIKGTYRSEYLAGGSANDTIYGYGGNDTIMGYGGNDVLYGGDGNDRFFAVDDITFVEKYWGTEGSDTMYGGKGNDLYLVDNINDVIFEYANEGKDSVYTPLASYTLPDNVEVGWQIIAGNKNMFGNSLNNEIHGNCGWNYLTGGEGNDTIFGGGYGHDTLDGGVGNDFIVASTRVCKLFGDEGNDSLVGCYGSDTLCGGAGNDRYSGFNRNLGNDGVTFKVGFGNDIIRDFTDYLDYSSDTTGYDTAAINTFSLSQVSLRALDIDKDTKLDALYISCGTYGSIQIEHYFDDSSRLFLQSNPGDGCIEQLVFSNVTLDYAGVIDYFV
jgi:Ca2+-binding RTX toxin-like protein